MPSSTTVNRSHLEKLYQQLGNLDTRVLYAGFAVMYKDLIEYLAARAVSAPAVTIFRNAYNTALKVDYHYLAEFYPNGYANLSSTDLPSGLTEQAVAGKMDLNELTSPNLVDKMFSFFGWAFFREYSKDLKNAIVEAYGEKGLPDVFDDRKTGAVNLAEKLLGKAIPNEFYWYPVTLYLCILLFKTDFKTVSQ